MKRIVTLIIFILILISTAFAVNPVVNLIGRFEILKLRFAEPEMGTPSGMIVDEIGQWITVNDEIGRRSIGIPIVDVNEQIRIIPRIEFSVIGAAYRFDTLAVSSYAPWLRIEKNGNDIYFDNNEAMTATGICFILKDSDRFIVYTTGFDGTVYAIDTNGLTLNGKEAIGLLGQIDPKKFEQSKIHANKLDLEKKFLDGKALVWGNTYYAPPRLVKIFWQKVVYPNTSLQIQYDLQGNGYQASLGSKSGEIWIVDPNTNYLEKIDVTKYSKILDTYEQGHIFTFSTYVGFGGNIYFYVAGDDFTEVFRIRRTWGDPDMYAMAINGYTKDEYGKYVDMVLPKMSKDELRLLRNHVYALYGYVFKDQALNAYFDKIVWYLPNKEVNQASIALPAERKALIERILEEEMK